MLNKIGEEELQGGYLLEWAYDTDVESPRARWSPLGHFYCWGRGIASPDKCRFDEPEEFIASELQKRFTQEEMEFAVHIGMFSSLRFAEAADAEKPVLEAVWKNLITGAEAWGEVDDYNRWRDDEEIAKAISYCAEAPELLSLKGVLLTVYRFEHSDVAYSVKPFNDSWDSGAVGFIWISDEELAEQGISNISKDEVRKILEAEVEEYSAWANGETYAVMLSKDDLVVEAISGYIGDDQLEEGKDGLRKVAAKMLERDTSSKDDAKSRQAEFERKLNAKSILDCGTDEEEEAHCLENLAVEGALTSLGETVPVAISNEGEKPSMEIWDPDDVGCFLERCGVDIHSGVDWELCPDCKTVSAICHGHLGTMPTKASFLLGEDLMCKFMKILNERTSA